MAISRLLPAPLWRPLLALALTGLAACGEDTVLSPTFGAGCSVGTLTPGDTKIGAFTSSSCVAPYYFANLNQILYESYAVQLEKGKAYMFTQTHVPDPLQSGANNVDPLLTLWGTDANGLTVPLAVSDDEAGDLNSVIFFIAPRSGTFQLVVSSSLEQDYGGYQVSANQCPVIGALGASKTYLFSMKASPCVRTSVAGTAADTTAYVFVTLKAEANEEFYFSITATGLVPVLEVFGPGFDTYANIHQESAYTAASGKGAETGLMAHTEGLYTVAIGGTAEEASGTFSLTFERGVISAPPFSPARHPTRPRVALPKE